MKRKIVYICSPLRSDSDRSLVRSNLYSRYAFERKCLPITPNTIFPQFLDISRQEEKRADREMGLQLLEHCDELWVFGPRITPVMKAEIELARRKNIPTKYISEDMDEE